VDRSGGYRSRVLLWIEFKLKSFWVIVFVIIFLVTPKEMLRNLLQFLGALRPEWLLIAAILAAFLIGRDWAERHRAQYDIAEARKKHWNDRKKYRTPEKKPEGKSE
jgi:hypothetical protein